MYMYSSMNVESILFNNKMQLKSWTFFKVGFKLYG